MKTDLHLTFPGTCNDAFGMYETIFRNRRWMTMKYKDAPPGALAPEGSADLVLHTAMPLCGLTLMGCDAWPGQKSPMAGFHISLNEPDEAECRRLFAALSECGTVQMPMAPTFWSPLFGMCTDRFGVEWMIGIPGPQQS